MPISNRFIRLATRYNTTSSTFAVPEKVIVQRVGAFRGGLVGFLMGLAVTSAGCYIYLLEEYQKSSNNLLSSIEELQTSTNKVLLHNNSCEIILSRLIK
jgi:hypothetical protein